MVEDEKHGQTVIYSGIFISRNKELTKF